MSAKIVSYLDDNGFFYGPATAFESPLEPGVFHIPGGAVDADPPTVEAGKRYSYVDGTWLAEDIPPADLLADAFEDDDENLARAVLRRLDALEARLMALEGSK